MKFVCTRGGDAVSFEEAVFLGSGGDDGLHFPETIPVIDFKTLESWRGYSYTQLCKVILGLFIDETEVPRNDLEAIIEKSFQSNFSATEIIPIVQVGDFRLAELWHGKSLAFKDLAMCVLSQTFDYFLRKQERHINVLVATSGDTGSSAILSVCGSPWIDIFVLFPLHRCTKIQEYQMTTVTDSNVHVFGGEGSADDFDEVINTCFSDTKFARDHGLTTMNSGNIVRILVQIVHHFYAYLNADVTIGTGVSIVVPSGGLGNVTAGCIAKEMGLPIKIVAVVNINGVVPEVLRTGIMEQPEQKMVTTSSVSMDIQVPSNFERLFYMYSNCNASVVRGIMETYKKSGKVTLPSDLQENLRKHLSACNVAESDVDEVIRQIWQRHRYHAEPHTAVGLTARMFSEKYGVLDPQVPAVFLACASPAKFPEAFERLGIPYELPIQQQQLLQKPAKYTSMLEGQDWVKILQDAVVGRS